MSMPKEWPILSGKDFCRGVFTNDDEQHCLLGWTYEIGIHDESLEQLRFCQLVSEVARQLGVKELEGRSVVSINDDESHSYKMLARIWNRVGAMCGYVVGNPECTRTGKLRPVK